MGDGNRRSKEWEKRIVADVFAAVGWNSGKRRLTKSTNTEAWWITGEGDSADDPQNEEDQILMDINRVWHSGRPMKDLLRAVKRGLRNGILPCLESVMDDSHRYHSAGSGSRFRLRCVVCRHSMNEYRSRAYFAKLIRHGLLSREAVQLPSPPSLAQQDQAQAPGIANPGRPLARPRRQYVTSVSDVLRTRQPRPSDLDLSGLGIELVRPSVDQRPQQSPEQSSPACQRDTPDNLRLPNTPSNLRPIQFPYTQADVVPIPGYPGWGRTNWTIGDGNCQFRAFAKALDNGRTSHQEVRRRVAQAMVQWPWRDFISHNYVSQQELEEDARRLAQDREWGNSTSLWLMGALWE
ncbi:hypothetical protein C364_06643, partial [Cryptococcus neoformans Bt63]